jgi:hypothetical protein
VVRGPPSCTRISQQHQSFSLIVLANDFPAALSGPHADLVSHISLCLQFSGRTVTKSRTQTVIAEQDVDSIFDDARIRALATDHKLPTTADLSALGIGTREAVRIFARRGMYPECQRTA